MSRRDYRAPGVYTERNQRRRSPIRLGDTGVPVFLGLASRGPVDEPVAVSSFDNYTRTFGPRVEGSYLPEAVYGFFANGGKSCFIMRIAHRRGRGEKATAAAFTVNDASGNPTLKIEAANEGTWGNDLEIAVELPEAKIQTYLTFDLDEGSTKATVKSARGFEKGTLVKISGGGKEHYAVLSDVRSKVLRFNDRDAVTEPFKSSDLIYVEPVEFVVTVRLGGQRERHTGLSFAPGSERYVERYIAKNSSLVVINVVESEAPIQDRLPVATPASRLTGGGDGLSSITPQDFIGLDQGPGYRAGLAALEENEEIDLIAVPDLVACIEIPTGFRGKRDIETVQEAVLEHCERLADRFAILDLPAGFDTEKAIAWRLQFDSAFGAIYHPWITVQTGEGNKVVPPSGHVAGVFSRCDRESGPHRAAANETVQEAITLQMSLEEEELGYLNAHQVNPIRILPSRGIRIWGARTLSSRKEWLHVPVRRVFNALRRSLYLGTQWVVFENNDQDLWRTVERQTKSFLQGLFDQGYFAGETAEDAFFVRCNAETNPTERIVAGELVAEIGVAPVRPAEFIIFKLEQQLPEQG